MKKNVNPWQIISAIMQALAAIFGSLKASHDAAHDDQTAARNDDNEPSSYDDSADA